MEQITSLLLTALQQAGLSLLHNWPYLLAGIVISALLKRYLDADKISAFLNRFRGLGVVAATGVAVGTPFCSCGTTAVILGMMASTMPWAPIVAFMVSSPLTSPEGLFYGAGLFGWPFALAFFVASIFLGLAGGAIAALLESRGWLAGQTRFRAPDGAVPQSGCGCSAQLAESDPVPVIRLESLQPVMACACDASASVAVYHNPNPLRSILASSPVSKLVSDGSHLLVDFYASGRQLLPMFLGFAFIGYLLNGLIPSSWISAFFGSGNVYSVPLAATLSLPLYINSEGSLPLIRALLENGMSRGAALAFLIAGSGTSIGALGGALTIARWRVVALVIGVLWAGAVISGYLYDLLLALNLI